MFSIGVEYLLGRAVAATSDDRNLPEWPPHPGRLFMALVHGWGETGADAGQRQALEWLESLGPPDVSSSAMDEVSFRGNGGDGSPVKTFVPPGDEFANSSNRAGRTFPTTTPTRPQVFFTWEEAAATVENLSRIETILSHVSNVGHSSSVTRLWLEPSPPRPTWVPCPGEGELKLRVPHPGRLATLEALHAAGRRPDSPGMWQSYSSPQEVAEPVGRSHFHPDMLVLRMEGDQRLGLNRTLALTTALRGLLMKAGAQPPSAIISGHAEDGGPLKAPHAAFIPLADTGHQHADGHVMGLGIVLPRGADGGELPLIEQKAILKAVASAVSHELVLGELGAWRLGLFEDVLGPKALQPGTWCGRARQWASVTPVVPDRHPRASRPAEALVAKACEAVGLPTPVLVETGGVSFVKGAPPAWSFEAMASKPGTGTHWHTHVRVTFPRPVEGPILLGRGRYRGYGLMRPIPSSGQGQP